MNRATALVTTACALAANIAAADHLEELVVTGTHDRRTIEVNEALVVSPDPARLLYKAPGAAVNGNGPISGIPQYRGMSGDRVSTTINGNQIGPAGPNFMDPPISYAAGQLESLQLYRGIAPVSVAQESLGGAIEATLARGAFGDSNAMSLSGRFLANTQSVNEAHHVNGALYLANNHHRVKLGAMTEKGNDARFPGGDILPSEYQRNRYDLAYGYRSGKHSLQLDYAHNDTNDAGTPSLPMDIQWIDGNLASLAYQYDLDTDSALELRLYGSDLDHGMTNYHLRVPPMSPGMHRRNIATADNAGFELTAVLRDESGQWQLGVDGFNAEHDSDIDNPNSPQFNVVNFNQAQRRITGLFAERQQDLAASLSAEFGLRYNRVEMDAGEVDGSPARMMPAARVLRDTFNAAERQHTDHNVDAVARLWYATSDTLRLYAGVARKTRSPSYQERYLWLPLQATGGLADGLTYTGQLDLDPEVAHELELGLDFNSAGVTLSPRLFYRDVKDYIQGVPSSNQAAVMLVRMMNAANGTTNPDPLEFANVDAVLFGFDMDWSWQIDTHWSLGGLLSYVRGERDDIDDALYRIAPPAATVALEYRGSQWSASVESVLLARQDRVSQTNQEQETAGSGIVNLRGSWAVSDAVRLAAGIDNLFDREYRDHLGGYNRAMNPDIARGERLPGYGINGFLQLSYDF